MGAPTLNWKEDHFLYPNQEIWIPFKTRKQNGSNNAWIMGIGRQISM